MRVQFLDQCDFLGAVPFLEALFAEDSFVHRSMLFEPHEAIDAVVAREPGDGAAAVIVNALDEV